MFTSIALAAAKTALHAPGEVALLDVREAGEFGEGHPLFAVPCPYSTLETDVPALLLTHSPGIFPMLARPPVRVVLAGHTHGGQVRIPLLGPFFLPRGSGAYPWGWYEMEGVHLFVSRGIGWSVAPLRWRCPPEIARIRMVPA